jgi:hypothetical protein
MFPLTTAVPSCHVERSTRSRKEEAIAVPKLSRLYVVEHLVLLPFFSAVPVPCPIAMWGMELGSGKAVAFGVDPRQMNDDIRAESRSEDKPFPDLLLLVTRTYVNLNPEEIGLKSCGLNTGMG